ncbi:MAG: hypothetical protein L0Z49_12580 [Actinobacteria bacterium]|nr:hypothetical protein [Actinomycetota bacterium]MCI0545257.1 hypothetical protein [Actinomycetota bacterium]
MVSPDGAGSSPPVGRRRRGMAAAAGLTVLAGGAMAIGILTTTDLQPTATTIPTATTVPRTEVLERPIDFEDFHISQIATDAQLGLTQVAVVEGIREPSLVVHDGSVYLFGTRDDRPGLHGWSSRTGWVWESLGSHIEDQTYFRPIVSTSLGMLTGNAGDQPHIWSSEDGTLWSEINLPVSIQESETIDSLAFGTLGDTLFVGLSTYIDTASVVAEAVAETLDTQVESLNWSWSTTSNGLSITVFGPLGWVAATMSTGEIGLDEIDAQKLLEAPYEEPRLVVWALDPQEGWIQVPNPGNMNWIDTFQTLDDRAVVALGYSSTGQHLMRTHDGEGWETIHPGRAYTGMTSGGGRIALYSNSPRLLISGDGLEWEEAALVEYFPGRLIWDTGPVAIGDGGYAAVVAHAPTVALEYQEPEPVTMTRDGFTLTMNMNAQELTLEGGGGRWTYAVYEAQNPEGISLDHPTRTVRFSNPETGEPLVSFTFDELVEAEGASWSSNHPLGRQAVLAFSNDGEEWIIQDLTVSPGENKVVTDLVVTESTVVAVVVDIATWFGSETDGGLEIWTAPIP